jgi:hypothetical protein
MERFRKSGKGINAVPEKRLKQTQRIIALHNGA